jgi:hypothetical protein
MVEKEKVTMPKYGNHLRGGEELMVGKRISDNSRFQTEITKSK